MSFSRHGDLVDEVLGLAGAEVAPRDQDLRWPAPARAAAPRDRSGARRPLSAAWREVLLVALEQQRHLGHAERPVVGVAVEDDVLHRSRRAGASGSARRAPSGWRRRRSTCRSRSARRWRSRPTGSSRTVRSMNDLKPISSICLIRIPSPTTRPAVGPAGPRGGHGPRVARRLIPASSSVFQYAASTALRNGSHSLYRRRLNVSSMNGVHSGRNGWRMSFMPACVRRAAALQPVAAMAGADDVLPHRHAALRARDDVVEVQLRAREAPPAVLAAVVVARVDVEAAEAHVPARARGRRPAAG